MIFRLKTNGIRVLAGTILGLATVASARADNNPGTLSDPNIIAGYPNVVTDPGFNGQSPNFQSGGGISPDWTYTPNFLNVGGGYLTLVSQTIATPGALDIYDIDLKFGATPPGQSMDFFVLWDGSIVGTITDPSGWQDDNFLVTAAGPASELGFAGNATAWATLGSLDVSFSGMVDPPPNLGPVPDQPVGLSLEAVTLLGLCAAAGVYRQTELRPALARAQCCTK
jgi:hypothetical protein